MKHAWLALAVCVCTLVALPGFADSQARIVRLSDIEGSVQIDRHSGQGFEKAILNMPVTQGVLVRTDSGGRAEIEFEDGSVLRLAPDTQVDFQQLSLRSSGARVSTINIGQGTTFVNYRHKSGDEFTVNAGGRDIPLHKSAHFRVEVSPEDVKLAVFDGQLELEGEDGSVKVKKNETATLDLTDNGRYLLAKGVDSSEYDKWDKDRESYHDTYANNSAYNSYPYYGRGDLNYYGNWYNVPGYGQMWQPYNVGYGWDPFYNGYWSYCPGFGYMYVSPYPWGWLPYRYGYWNWVPGWGWGWMPGPRWTIVTVPTVVNRPSGYVQPTPPAPSLRPGSPVGPIRPTVPVRVTTMTNVPSTNVPLGRAVVNERMDVEPAPAPRPSGIVVAKPPAVSGPTRGSSVMVPPSRGTGIIRGGQDRPARPSAPSAPSGGTKATPAPHATPAPRSAPSRSSSPSSSFRSSGSSGSSERSSGGSSARPH